MSLDSKTPLEELGEAVFPKLSELLKSLLEVVATMGRGARVVEEDHYGFMCLVFLSRQEEHARSILKLGSSRDTVLVARSMLEGMAGLSWATTGGSQEWASKWRAYSVVHDWKLMREKERRGLGVTPAEKERIERRLLEDGDQFLKREGQKVRARGESVRERHYHKSWLCGQTRKDVHEASDASVMHAACYEQFSDYHHWGTGAIGQALARSTGGVYYSSQSLAFSAWAMDVGFRSLYQTAVLTAKYLQLPEESHLNEVGTRFNEWQDSLVAQNGPH